MRGLSELPWVAAEVPEGYFITERFPLTSLESKPQDRLPAYSTERNQDNIWLLKAAGFLSVRERWLEMERAS